MLNLKQWTFALEAFRGLFPIYLTPVTGIEPATLRLVDVCSIH